MEFNRKAVLQCFLTETEESLGIMEQGLLQLEENAEDAEQLHAVFRVVHNLKGNAAALGYSSVSDFAHSLESLLDKLREKELDLTPNITSWMLRTVDALRSTVSTLRSGGTCDVPGAVDLLSQIDLISRSKGSGPARGPSENETTKLQERADESSRSFSSLRVDLERVDRLVNLAGEIAIARGRLTSALRSAGVSDAIIDLDQAAEALYSEMQELVMRLRMVPLGPSFAQLLRIVRDAAKREGKLVKLQVSGGEVELDARVIDLVRNPLVHLVRNAVDHGIETPAVRQAKGKPGQGTVHLLAGQDGGNVVVTVKDDGAGIDRDAVLKRARELGFVTEANQPSDHELYQLLFEPGFSTAAEVTDLSGRGVGMDVVRRNIESLHGSVTLDSKPGMGMTVSMRIPLTLAIIDGFAVQAGDNCYVIPLDNVLECIEAADDQDPDAIEGVVAVRGEPLPFVRLRRAFGCERARGTREQIVIVRNESGRIGLAVDSLQGEIQAVVKPLGKAFASVNEFSGSTILGDGSVALLLDVARLSQQIEHYARSSRMN